VSQHNVARATLYRYASEGDWQKHKNRVQTQIQVALDDERASRLIDEGRKLDDTSLKIAQAMLGRVGRKLQRAYNVEQNDTRSDVLSPQELRELSVVAGNAQRLGKLALGQAQEISKVSADVSNPEAFRSVMEQLDELAAARSQGDCESVH
jgi:hypothetical protein